MKRVLCLVFIFFVSIQAFCDEYVISKIKCYDSTFYSCELTFKYNDKEDEYYIFRSTYSRSYWFTLTPEKLNALRNNLTKVKEWEKVAKDNVVELSKELPDSVIEVEGTMKSGADWYYSRFDIPLKFYFMSHMTDEIKSVALAILGGEKESTKNKYITIEFEDVTFIDSQIDDLIDAISEETVKEAILKHESEKNTADLFN